ncbi:MAG: hypothetical protein IJC62_03935 [Clostridia bacterium]|nr:hypothetical protein [Clostridia bacterium]
MENFAAKHSRVLIITLGVLFLTCVGLLTFVYFDFTAKREGEMYADYVAEVEMKNAAYSLCDSLDSADTALAYHDAEMAAYHASRCGKENEAAFFYRISAYLRGGGADLGAVAAEVRHFLDGGEVSGIDAADSYYGDEPSESAGAIFDYKLEAAGESANKLFGLSGTLKPITKSTDGRLVFACENAYAVIDEASGVPLEAGISVSCGEPILTSVDCERYARKFLKKCFSGGMAEDAALIETYPEGDEVYGMVFKFRDIEVTLSVKRDTGKVVRMNVR